MNTRDKLLADAPALSNLFRQVEQGRVPHALLLLGVPNATLGVGTELAQYLLCSEGDAPCGHCASCREFLADTHPDFWRVSEDTKTIKTGDIERLQEWIAIRPHHSKRKVYMLPGVDTMTLVAANRLLKTLEEPNDGIVAILTSANSQAVLTTIRSRCFPFFIHPKDSSPFEDPWTSLFRSKAEGDSSEEHSFAPFFAGVVQWTQHWVVDHTPALLLADEWLKLSVDWSPENSLRVLASYLQDVLHVSLGRRDVLQYPDIVDATIDIAGRFSSEAWVRALEIVLEAKVRCLSHVIHQLNIERMCIRLGEVYSHV